MDIVISLQRTGGIEQYLFVLPFIFIFNFFFKFQSIYLPILPSRLDLLNTYLSYHNLYLSAPLKIAFGMAN